VKPLVHEFTVGCAPEAVTIEPRAGGRIFERAAGGPDLRERNVRGWAGLLPAYLSATGR
jgi:hypothetical protein